MKKDISILMMVAVAFVAISFFGVSGVGAAEYQHVVVKLGDSMWKISREEGVSFKTVLKLNRNRFANPNLIHPGDKILIPQNSHTKLVNKEHSVVGQKAKSLHQMKYQAGIPLKVSEPKKNENVADFKEKMRANENRNLLEVATNILKSAFGMESLAPESNLFLYMLIVFFPTALLLSAVLVFRLKPRMQFSMAGAAVNSSEVSSCELRKIAEEFLCKKHEVNTEECLGINEAPLGCLESREMPSGAIVIELPEQALPVIKKCEFFAVSSDGRLVLLRDDKEERTFVDIKELAAYIKENYGYPGGAKTSLYNILNKHRCRYNCLDDEQKRTILNCIRAS